MAGRKREWPRTPGAPTVVAVRALVPLIAILLTAACGSDRPPLQVASDDTGAGTDAPRVAGPPDAGSRTGHGNDLQAQFAQPARGLTRVPEIDRSPPLAMLRLDAGASQPIVHASPVRRPRRPTVTLVRPAITATALIRDADGGTGRIRVSILYATRCGDTDRQHAAYFPPAQIQNIRVAPGTRIPVQRTRRAHVRFPEGCEVLGKAFAEATNASGLESFSDPIWFTYTPPD
jgi:hypothetical protein